MAETLTTEAVTRICVVGCAGSGKSTFARELGVRLGLPVHHLDAMLWKPGWKLTDRETQTSLQLEVSATQDWVVDGNWGSTTNVRFPRAQAIVWLDLPTHTAMWGVLSRWAHGRGKTRPDMAEGCAERLDWTFLKWVYEFRTKHRQRTLDRIHEHGAHARLFHVTNRKQLPAVLETLASLNQSPGCQPRAMHNKSTPIPS